MNAQKETHPQYFEVRQLASGAVIQLHGSWEISESARIRRQLMEHSTEKSRQWTIDGTHLTYLDTTGAMLALDFVRRNSESPNAPLKLEAVSRKSEAILALVAEAQAEKQNVKTPQEAGLLEKTGRYAYELFELLDELVCFTGQIGHAAFETIKNPRRLRVKEICNQVQATGLEAVGIVFLVNFLIGIVIAYLSGLQLEQYGANVFIVDGIGLGVTRELAPILAAIVVAGRSGSAFTAQLGAMKLNQEIDAAETLGLSAIEHLVLPRVLALIIVLPILVFVGDIAGVLGGLLAADLRLGVSATTFLDRFQIVVPIKTVMVGLSKAPFFAFFIAAIACHLGLSTEANAQSVGEHTTMTVVRAIVAVILLNALFAVLFSELGI